MVPETSKGEDLDQDIFKQKIDPLENLIKNKRMPILFIGSGVSGRYRGLCTWKSLLETIASIIGIDKFQLNGMSIKLKNNNPDSNIYPKLASDLSDLMMDGIKNKTITRDTFPNMTELEWDKMSTLDPFKVMICSLLKDDKILDDPILISEIESFKKLADKIPAVITTNYDDFLEKEIFQNFSVLVFPDDYYFSRSDGYGEILKIHGTIEKPDSLIVTESDYNRLRKDSKVIMSRLISLMCDHPVIFLGYSLNDEEIHDIIYDLVSSLKQTDMDRIRGNLINVQVASNLKKPIHIAKRIEQNGKYFEIMQLYVPNFEIVFHYLDKITPVATAIEIKKYRSMIRKIVLSTNPGAKKLTIINENNIDLDSNNLAVIFGSADSLNSLMKGITGYEIVDSVLDVLMNRNGILESSETAFITWISQERISGSPKYIPVFYYMLKFGIDHNSLPKNVKEFIDSMIEKMSSKIEEIKEKCPKDMRAEDIDEFLKSQTVSFPRCDALMYFQHIGIIDREQCRVKLQAIYEIEKNRYGGSTKIKTGLRCAVSHLDVQEYLKKGCAEPRTLYP